MSRVIFLGSSLDFAFAAAVIDSSRTMLGTFLTSRIAFAYLLHIYESNVMAVAKGETIELCILSIFHAKQSELSRRASAAPFRGGYLIKCLPQVIPC